MQTFLFLNLGIFGYWKYGEATTSPLTQNLPPNETLAQSVLLILVIGVTLGYAIQFYIPIEIMFPSIRRKISLADRNPFIGEILFRFVMVLGEFFKLIFIPFLCFCSLFCCHSTTALESESSEKFYIA